MTTHTDRNRRWPAAFPVAALVGLVGLSGCFGWDDAGVRGANEAPEAVLTAEKSAAWTGERVVFNGSDSRDPDGTISLYRFDFGDGNTSEVSGDGRPVASHAYTKGGEYTVTLLVVDDGANETGSASDTASVAVAIDEEHDVPSQAAFSGVGGDGSEPYRMAFNASDGVERAAANLSLRSVLAAGSSEITIRFLQNETVLAEHNETVNAGENRTVLVEAELPGEGLYHLEVEAASGAAQFGGDLFVIYSDRQLPAPTPT